MKVPERGDVLDAIGFTMFIVPVGLTVGYILYFVTKELIRGNPAVLGMAGLVSAIVGVAIMTRNINPRKRGYVGHMPQQRK